MSDSMPKSKSLSMPQCRAARTQAETSPFHYGRLLKAFLICGLIFLSLRWTFPHPYSISWQTRGGTVSFCSHDYPITARSIELPVDHFNVSDLRTFKNRYWLNATHYQRGGPIFFYDGGEAGLSDDKVIGPLTGVNVMSVQLELARRFHGIAIMWEHRFYGASMPFEYDNVSGISDIGYDAYKYLTNEQALEDAVYFARNFELPGFADLNSDSTPWIWIGGSYPGVRAAIIRQRNPDVFFASWASSAPVQTQVEMPVYYNTILQTMPANCSADVHAAITYADEILVGGNETAVNLLRRAVSLANDANPNFHPHFNSSEDMTYFNMAQILSYAFQGSSPPFQSVGYNRALGEFCNQLETWNPSNFSGFTMDSPTSALSVNLGDAKFTADGVAAHHGAESAFYAYMYAQINKSFRDADGKKTPGLPRVSLDRASWAWQLCSQDGKYHVTSFPSPTNIVSRFYTAQNILEQTCYLMFRSYAPAKPDVDAFLKYGGWAMRPSNVMFTNGEFDPWRALSVHATSDINQDAPMRPRTTRVPLCNEPPEGDAIFGLVYSGEVHCSDLRKASQESGERPFDGGIELFSNALSKWLTCFSNGTETLK